MKIEYKPHAKSKKSPFETPTYFTKSHVMDAKYYVNFMGKKYRPNVLITLVS